jgi:hypothetical protein
MQPIRHDQAQPDPAALAFYADALNLLWREKVPFLIGGAYALERYTGIRRDTKDLDVFVRPRDREAALQVFTRNGDRIDRPFPHWLNKVYRGNHVVDIIFSSGNALVEVDDDWFTHATSGTVLGRPVLMCPPEEMIWSKAFIMERERFDGADINHLLLACAATLDWTRLLRRFATHWRLLLCHLILFGYVYPSESGKIPDGVMRALLERLGQESGQTHEPVCRGTLLSREQYLIDVHEWRFRDSRLAPEGKMSPEQIRLWTSAIGIDNPALNQ